MVKRGTGRRPAAATPSALTIVELFGKYLEWCEKNREPRTFEWYRDHLQRFLDHLGDKAQMAAGEIRPFHVVE